MTRMKIPSLALIALSFVLLQGCNEGTVYIAFGQHADFYHSYRGDTPDDDGFGLDIDVITQTVDYLDDHPRVKLSWEFDSWQTLEQRLPGYAPELFDRIKARVAEKDEVRFQSWNGGSVSAQTPEEFAASIAWQRANLIDIFGRVENGVYPQEMMHTPSLIPAYVEQGVEWVSLFYSASGFTAFRNEVELTMEEQYNPLWLETPDGRDRMIVIPTYHHADIANYMGLGKWARYVHNRVDGDALIFVAFDADSVTWPLLLELLVPIVEKIPYVEFCTPGEYLEAHEPVGTIVINRDLADGVFDGYSSWAEKPINHEIWTAVERSRIGEARTNSLLDRFEIALPQVEAILADNFQWRMQTLKTTHFGLATPALHQDRLVAAREHAAMIEGLSSQALDLTAAEVKGLVDIGTPPDLPFDGTSDPWFIHRAGFSYGPVLVKVPLRFDAGDTFSGGIRVFREGEEIPSGLVDVALHPDGSVEAATLAFIDFLGTEGGQVYWISRTGDPAVAEPDYGMLPAVDEDLLDNGSLVVGFDSFGYPVSMERQGEDYARGRLIRPGVTFRGAHRGPLVLRVEGAENFRGRGFLHQTGRCGTYRLTYGECAYTGSLGYTFRVYAGLDGLEIETSAAFPDLPDVLVSELTEAMPVGLRPDLDAPSLRVWKHNYFDDVTHYDVTEPAPSINNHVTAGWAAVDNGDRAVLVANDAERLASMAFCPLKVRRALSGNLVVEFNPFGSYWGRLPRHDAMKTAFWGLGEFVTTVVGEQFQPSAQAYAGEETHSRILVIPYAGGEPCCGDRLRAEAYAWPPDAFALD